MIAISRCTCPTLLQQGKTLKNPECKAQVVQALRKMQHGKCCYCEKEIPEDGGGQAIEHFHPKAKDKFPHLENEWSNLLHACPCCNGKKRKQFPVDSDGNSLLINPAEVGGGDPEDHIEFNVDDEDGNFGRVSTKNGSQRGRVSIDVIGLDLVAKRRERTTSYNRLYAAYVDMVTAPNEVTGSQKVRAFEALLQANNEHAAFARAFARAKRVDTRFGVKIPHGADICTCENIPEIHTDLN